jgi:hypothetical protein
MPADTEWTVRICRGYHSSVAYTFDASGVHRGDGMVRHGLPASTWVVCWACCRYVSRLAGVKPASSSACCMIVASDARFEARGSMMQAGALLLVVGRPNSAVGVSMIGRRVQCGRTATAPVRSRRGWISSTGHSGTHAPQSRHSSGLMFSTVSARLRFGPLPRGTNACSWLIDQSESFGEAGATTRS